MRKLLKALGSAIGITLIVALVLTAGLWLLGGYFGFGGARPFESVSGRLVGIAVLWIAALLVILVILLRRNRRDKAMAEEIVAADPADTADEFVAAELEEMRGKLRQALSRLRKSRFGHRHLYELPWYIIIGPPGAGKTTAILNSGLNFPLAHEVERGAVSGVGGTRNCDWWFTDGAVLVDTAGRYTAQESDARADNAAWLGFLGILKKHRPRQPINGAIVAISLSDLSLQDEQTQKSHAAAIRRRLGELRERLGVRFPVYVLFTKADLLAGFTEFFEPLGKTERQQVWGFTLPIPKGRDASPVAGFDGEYQALIDRLNEQSLERIQAETDPARRSLIAGFPLQVASMQQVARDFVSELFQENRYEHRHLLRGAYFTSGTQEGTPIDRLMMGMARTFGIGRQSIGSGRGTGRSYFLTRLLEGVIFRESGLVSADDRVERRYRWTRRGAIAAAILLAVGASALWTRSYLGNLALAAEVGQRIGLYQETAAAIPPSPVGDTDLPGVVPALNILRDLPGNPTAIGMERPEELGWGLYQGDVIGTSAQQAYRAALNRHLLPRLLLRLEEQMQGATNEPELLYEALKVYLTLGLIGPMNADLVREWMALDWSLAYPGPTREALRADLASHLDALLSQPITAIELNNDLVERVRVLLTEMPQAQRIYTGIIKSPAATELPEWRLTEIGGPALNRVITRSSGKPLTEGVPGIFTYDGFHGTFLDQALSVAERIAGEAWVLDRSGEVELSQATSDALTRDVLNLYFDDFIDRYNQILGDVDIVPLESPSHAAEITNILSGPTSPIVNILEAVAAETRLTEDRAASADAGTVQDAAATELARAAGRQVNPALRRILGSASGNTSGGEVGAAPGAYVEERFAWLHRLVASEKGQPSPLDQLVNGSLREVSRELSNMVGDGSPQNDASALVRFQQEASLLEGPIQRWAAQIAAGAAGITADSTRAAMNARWQANVLPLCQQATQGKYPFDRRAQADIALQDFSRLFGAGGLIDSFFQENLAEHVDTRTRPWTWKQVGGSELGISDAVLEQMQNAAQIRDAFFANGATPAVSFQITPEALDPNAQGVGLEIDGQTLGFQHGQGQPGPTAITWPGNVGVARILFVPPRPGSEHELIREGPWGWFRLLDAAEVRNTGVSDRKRIIFNVGGRLAIFQMQASMVLNPFALPALHDFSCPASF